MILISCWIDCLIRVDKLQYAFHWISWLVIVRVTDDDWVAEVSKNGQCTLLWMCFLFSEERFKTLRPNRLWLWNDLNNNYSHMFRVTKLRPYLHISVRDPNSRSQFVVLEKKRTHTSTHAHFISVLANEFMIHER